jgi:hypothetical protein
MKEMLGFFVISNPCFFVLVEKIKAKVRLWVIAGAKKLGYIMPGE